MKKVLSRFTAVLLALLLLPAAFCLQACGSADTPAAAGSGKLHIVATIFPEYDWVMNVLGDNPAGAEVTLLLDSGVDLHSFQPSAKDILTVSTCDLFIYVGGTSDQWVNDALKESGKAKNNPHWQEKIRQTVQNIKRFVRTERGCYALAPAA